MIDIPSQLARVTPEANSGDTDDFTNGAGVA
jgi:hypothetical protein